MRLRSLVAALLATLGPATAREEIRLVTWPTLSPDGEMIVFEWLDQLWRAPSTGGEAVRLTDQPGRVAYPVFTPDGERIVFSSDATGSMQVHSIPAAGGEAVRHTFHSEGNALECLSPDGTRAIVSGLRDASGHRPQRLIEIDLSDRTRERRLFDATGHSAAWSPDGSKVLFCRGGEQLFRKGYVGSRSSQLWLFDRGDGSFQRLLPEEGEVRSPRWHPDGGGFFHVSHRHGTLNLCSTRFDGETETLTRFEGDGVILREISADGSTFLLRRNWEVLLFRPAEHEGPVPVEFWTDEKLPDVSEKLERVTGTSHADFTPDLEGVAFAAAGELWWMPGRKKEPRRLTETAAAESDVRFSPDGKWLYFLRDDGLEANYHRARLVDGKLADEARVTRGPLTKSRLKLSPDGRRIAWVAGNGDVHTADADGSDARRIFETWDRPTLDWSPDGRWLALAAKDAHSNRDIWLAAADGSRPPVNLTRDPAFEGSPRWSPDGRRLVFTARRNAAREAELWRIDFGKGGIAPDATDETLLAAGDRARPIGTRGIEPTRVIWSPASETLLFQSATTSNQRLYSVSATGGEMETVAETRGVPIRFTPEGELLWRVDRTPTILREGKSVSFPISMRVRRDRQDILRTGFRRIWRTLGERFYDTGMGGVDWPAMLAKYEPLAVQARDSRQFDRVVGHLLGELNASHLTFVSRVWPVKRGLPEPEPPTAHPGFSFEPPVGNSSPLVIRRVLPGSPAAEAEDGPLAGERVSAIAGQAVTDESPLHPFFNGQEGEEVVFRLRAADGAEREVAVTCISYADARQLDELAAREAARERAAPDFAYFALERMKWDDFAALEREIYRASLEKSGLILDLRDNGGGQVADHLLAIFLQPVHAFTIPRDGPRGYPHDRRVRAAWDKPLVVLCNQNTYSNAEIFCHAIKLAGRAPLVGIPTAGGVISAVKVNIPDVGTLQVPFRGWFHAATGEDLDLNGAVPDHLVPMTPADQHAGRDPQLARALELLREQVDAAPPPVEPKRRNGAPASAGE